MIGLFNDYIEWYKNEFYVDQFDNKYRITIPFSDEHNDYINLFVEEISDQIIISDNSFLINDLKNTGIDLINSERSELLKRYLRKAPIDIEIDNSSFEIKTITTKEDFSETFQSYIDFVLKISNLEVLKRDVGISKINEIKEYFKKYEDSLNIQYEKNIELDNDIVYHFDMYIETYKTKNAFKFFNRYNPQQFKSKMFEVVDIHSHLPEYSFSFIFRNLNKDTINKYKSFLSKYPVGIYDWTQKDEIIRNLST